MNSVDNIILNGQKVRKRKGKGILVILFLLFLILVALCGAYWYFITYMQETPKTAFFKYVGQNNFKSILDTDIYYTMLDKMNEQSYKSKTTANLTTTIKNDLTQNIDVSKLELILNSESNKEEEKTLFDAKLNYSSNDIFNVKLISDKDNIGIGSNEILDKYVATSKVEYANSIRKTTGMETTTSADILNEELNKFSKNKINLTEEYKKQKVNEYSNLIYNLVPEEAVTENENVIVTIDSKTVNAKAYTLNLDSNKYKEILTNILSNLKNDKEFIDKIVTGNEIIEEIPEPEISPIPNMQVDYTEGQTEQHQTAVRVETNNENSEQLDVIKEVDLGNLVGEEDAIIGAEENLENEMIEDNSTDLFENLILAILFNQKIDCSAENLIADINTELNNIENINKDIKITVYVRFEEEQPNETIKLVMEFGNISSLDIEYQSENEFKITYLEEVDKEGKTVTEGTSINVERISSDIQTKFNMQFSDIENKKVIAKTQVELETAGSRSSKDYTNDIIIKHNDSEGEIKVNIENTIDFQKVQIQENLNEENTIFVDRLTDEEATTLYTQILTKMMQVYSEKIVSLTFIDTNSSPSVIEQPNIQNDNAEEKAQIKQKLIETVSNMMGEAQNNGGTLTIQDLQNLQIEGYNVSSIVTDELATIKINGYTFMIDSNFVLSE